MAGWSTGTLPLSPVLCLALKSGDDILGVLVFKPKQDKKLTPDQTDLLISITNQIALALAKKKYDQETQTAQLLKESEKLHQTLFSGVSHELRTPLTAIMGAATALQTQLQEQKSEGSLQMLTQEIVSASERLNHIFANLLDVTRLESGIIQLKSEWFDLSELLQETLRRQEKLLSQHSVDYEPPPTPFYFFGDFELLEHALSNVLLNAVRYSPAGSKIRLRLRQDGGNVLIDVIDQGPGIPEALLGQIFEKFYRLPGTATGGLGLGLSIAKNLIELHHGRIWVKNNPDQGATFTLAFPASELPERIPG